MGGHSASKQRGNIDNHAVTKRFAVINLKTTRHAGWLALLSLALSCGWTAGGGEARTPNEYQVKAAFLFNFTKFVEWPAAAFPSTNAPFVIGVVGDDPFGKNLDDLVRGETVRGHPLVIKRLRVDEDLTGCHTLFISGSEKGNLEFILEPLISRPILTVGDTGGFAERGVTANLLLVEGSVKMEINLKSAETTGLRVSSKLLSLARIVESGRGEANP
jgi:hypothetical protein